MALDLAFLRSTSLEVKKMRKDDISLIQRELERVRKKNSLGLLIPREVWESAVEETHPLHPFFQWDDTEAAKSWRDEQSRRLIRFVVVRDESHPPIPFYASLKDDRCNDGGYRRTADIITSDELKQQMLETAKWELSAWVKRNEALKCAMTQTEWAELVIEGAEVEVDSVRSLSISPNM